jgi:putative DNA-invertase from lambdoid prophage Rac
VKVFFYARVSKALDQTPENQLMELRAWAKAGGHEVVEVFVDEISSRDTRPAKEECMRQLRLGYAEAVAFVALDRWGRDMAELVMNFEEFISSGIGLISLREGLNLNTATGKLHAHILSAFANFERERIRERTISGLARAKAQGKKLGRPKGAKDKKKRKPKKPPLQTWTPFSGSGQNPNNGRFSVKED